MYFIAQYVFYTSTNTDGWSIKWQYQMAVYQKNNLAFQLGKSCIQLEKSYIQLKKNLTFNLRKSYI